MQQKIMYECGCFASGDNVATSCPIHGDGILQTCVHVDSCGMSKMVGGFPMCYNPFEPIGHVCKDCAEE